MSMSMIGFLGILLLLVIVVGTAGVMLAVRLVGAREVKDDHPS